MQKQSVRIQISERKNGKASNIGSITLPNIDAAKVLSEVKALGNLLKSQAE